MHEDSYTKKALVRIEIYTEDLESKKDGFKYHDYITTDIFLTDSGLDFFDRINLTDSIRENLINEDQYVDNIIIEEGFKDFGIYEIIGEYWEYWEKYSDYESMIPEYDCHWELRNFIITPYKGNLLKSCIESMYHNGAISEAMNYIEIFKLEKDLINTLNYNSDAMLFRDLFKKDKRSIKDRGLSFE